MLKIGFQLFDHRKIQGLDLDLTFYLGDVLEFCLNRGNVEIQWLSWLDNDRTKLFIQENLQGKLIF